MAAPIPGTPGSTVPDRADGLPRPHRHSDPTEEERPLFAPGTSLGGRFRIVRVLGQGGMGVVYEALDEILNRRVALKCARPGYHYCLAPEARAARDVSHYNICKVHEMHVLTTPEGLLDCLSMEFIEGETLAERISRDGPISSRAAREIALQICAGLAQAHRQGVIHGDLKGGNIILARSPENRVRAVITDFGIATTQNEAENETRSRGGTIDYMAPEQLSGGSASVLSDIYALGVMFHVMLTGRVPARIRAVQRAQLEKRRQAGSQDNTVTLSPVIREEDWRRRIDVLPGRWNKLTARCLAPQPDKRYRSVGALAAALDPRRRAAKWAAAAVVAVALVAGGREWRSPAPLTAVRLAVLPISVEGDPFESAQAVAMEVTDRLTGVRRKFTVISPREAERNQAVTPVRARAALGATHVLETHVRASGGTISTTALLSDLQSGRTMVRLSGAYGARDTAALAKALVATVTGAFQLPAAKELVSAAAYPYYAQGVELLRQDNLKNADKAIPLFAQAIGIDPGSALPYAGLAQAQAQRFIRGDGSQWLDLAEATAAKAGGIHPDSVPVLLASGFIEQQRGRYEEAVRDFTRAAALAPEDSETWRQLAACYDASNRPDEAIATYRKAIAAEPNYYRHYLFFGTFYFNRSQFDRAEQQYRRVIAIAPGLASGHMNLGLALMEQAKFPEAETELLKALAFGESRNLLMNIGGLYYREERFVPAARYFEKSMAVGVPSAMQYRDLGDAYRQLGRRRHAAAAYRSGIALAREDLSRNPRRADWRALLGLMSAFLGDRPAAEFEISQALVMGPEIWPVIRDSAIAYEALGQRGRALAVVRNASGRLLEQLSRQPDLHGMQKDPGFRDLLSRHPAE
jgi:tetratricopeptide (TPR) repeat protein